jgi:hypothetical protein
MPLGGNVRPAKYVVLPQPASAAAIAKAAIALIPRLLFFKTLYLDPAIPEYPCPSGENRLWGGSPCGTAAREIPGNPGVALKQRKISA